MLKRPCAAPVAVDRANAGYAQPESNDDGGDPSTNIDNAKKRTFLQVFQTLPDSVKVAYKDNRGKPGCQLVTTQIINSAIKRNGHQLVALDTTSPWLEEKLSHRVDRYCDEAGLGMLLEEAETKLGGPENVQKALRENRCYQSTTPTGIDMYYIPRTTMGKRETFSHERHGHKMTLCNDEGFQELQETIVNQTWDVPQFTATQVKDRCHFAKSAHFLFCNENVFNRFVHILFRFCSD